MILLSAFYILSARLETPLEITQAGESLSSELSEESVSEKKCPAPPSLNLSGPEKLLVFMSFSIPLETWKAHSKDLEKVGGTFVLRGLPENSFEVLAQQLAALRESGVDASIILDPTEFEKHQIGAVPALVLQAEDRLDKITGNIQIQAALERFADTGETAPIARRLLKDLEIP